MELTALSWRRFSGTSFGLPRCADASFAKYEGLTGRTCECTGICVTLWTGTPVTSPLRCEGLKLRFTAAPRAAFKYLSRHRGRGNVGIPKGFPKSAGRVGSQLYGFPPFPHSVISMACIAELVNIELLTGPETEACPGPAVAGVATCLR